MDGRVVSGRTATESVMAISRMREHVTVLVVAAAAGAE